MPDFLLRNLDEHLLEHLKDRARKMGRSLQAELRLVIERSAQCDRVDPAKLAATIRNRLSGRPHSDSTILVSEDRQR